MNRQPACDRGRCFQSRMHAAAIVEHEEHRDRVLVILDFLAVRVCQPRESSHLRPNRQVVSLDMRRADVPLGGMANLRNLLSAVDSRWAVTSFGGFRLAALAATVRLHKLAEVNIGAEGVFDGRQAGAKAVAG